MSHYDRTSTTSKPSGSRIPDPRLASVKRPLFESEESLSQFMKNRPNLNSHLNFSGPSLKAMAPVQSEENGWLNYLSRRELRELGDARKMRVHAGALGLGALAGQGVGILLFVTSSVAAPFVLLAASAVGIGAGLHALKAGRDETAIEREGKRRRSDAEVAARHMNPSRGPAS